MPCAALVCRVRSTTNAEAQLASASRSWSTWTVDVELILDLGSATATYHCRLDDRRVEPFCPLRTYMVAAQSLLICFTAQKDVSLHLRSRTLYHDLQRSRSRAGATSKLDALSGAICAAMTGNRMSRALGHTNTGVQGGSRKCTWKPQECEVRKLAPTWHPTCSRPSRQLLDVENSTRRQPFARRLKCARRGSLSPLPATASSTGRTLRPRVVKNTWSPHWNFRHLCHTKSA